ncbi:murein biosynthesis integral membrane protein MurJ [Pontiella agarivorans]|uniref:Probable lipid II flippase MurJ n=1 Tax=Pontiella agarivorans TaxID=3038953 RepID=A0ABU5N1W6_9BACT|nr:murein biosynthesis integral membrane protein MurJ [Pontiella agarivorans]MDZ8120448.1 murein biosynthesis integral membrane protein MurJ [Pontiella agarivorans]
MKDGKVIRSAGVVGSFTLLSRGLGMLRDIIIAYHFGTSIWASAFFVAFTLPNLFRRLFGEGALSAAFVPIFIETRTKEGDQSAWNMAAKVVTMTAALLSSIAIIGVLLFSVLTRLPCFSDKWITTFELSRIMFPYVVFICLAALSMAVLNSYRHFATSAFAPCLLNLILIVIMLAVFPVVGKEPSIRATALAWGVLLAGISQIAIQLPALKRFGCPFKFSNRWNDPKIRKMLLLMGPAALGMAVTQFNVLIDRLLALWIGDWAPAALFYSERMIYFPLGIIATAMGTVLLPTFSTQRAEDNHAAMSTTITHSLRHLSFIMLPAALGLLVLAPDILSCIFEWGGRFSEYSTLLSARALMFYAPGLLVFSAAKVFVPAFYAMQDTRTPVRIGIYIVLINLALNIIFILILPEYWKHAGMAFSTVLAEAVGMSVLGILLTRRVKNIEWPSILRSSLRHLLSALLMAAAAWLTARLLLPVFGNMLPLKLANMASLTTAMAIGALTYFLLSLALRAPELRELKSALLRR